MGKLGTIIIGLVIVSLNISGNAFAQSNQITIELTDEEKAWISSHPVIKSTNKKMLVPFDFLRDGKAMGFAIDYINLIAKKVGLKVEYVNAGSWRELLDQVKEKKIDITHTLISNEKREEYLNFTDPYLEIPEVTIGRAGEEKINSIDDLLGKRIGVVKGQARRNYYKENYPEFILVEYDNILLILEGILKGEVDVYTGTTYSINYYISQNFFSGLEYLSHSIGFGDSSPIYYRLAVRKDWPILNRILEKGIVAISEEEFSQLTKKWLIGSTNVAGIGLTNEEKEWLEQNKTIKVAAAITFKPMEFIDENGDLSGISRSYLNEISKRLKVEFKWAKNKNWGEGLEMIRTGDADILTVVTPSEEREKHIRFTDVYLSLAHVIFSRKDGYKFTTIDDLNGFTIAQSKGTQVVEFIKENYPDINIIETENTHESIRLVTSDVADAYIGDIPSVTNSMASLGYTNIVITGTSPYISLNAMGIRRDLPLLASAIQKALNDIPEMRKNEILNEWISIENEIEPDYNLIWMVLLGLLVVVAFILFWLNKLHNEVKRREIVERKLILSQEIARKAQVEAEAANKAKSSFLANVSHEIRTPLNAIMGFSEIMETGLFGEIKQKKYKEYLADIRGSGNHLALVIKNILDLAKIEAGKWPLNEVKFDIYDSINGSLKIVAQMAQEKNINLIKPKGSSVFINGDNHAFQRVFINLLSNAIKFTPEGGEVDLSVRLNDQTGNVIIEVNDTGIGIAKEHIEHVMTEFGQIHESMDADEHGTGLGLSIVKGLVELQNGTFQLISELGIGTKAIISIPSA